MNSSAPGRYCADYAQAASRYGAQRCGLYRPNREFVEVYESLYREYRALSCDETLRRTLQTLTRTKRERSHKLETA